jgi:hypothetical protein
LAPAFAADMAPKDLRCYLSIKAEKADDDGELPIKRDPDVESTSSVGNISTESVASKFSADKTRYNKFNYRLRSSSTAVKEYYKDLVKNKNQPDMDQFVEDLISMGQDLPADYIARKRKIVDERELDSAVEWVPWRKQAEIEGHDELLEMVEAGTVESKRNPKLPADSKIEHPYNLLARATREVEHRRKKTVDENEMTAHEAISSDNHEAFVKEHATNAIQNRVGYGGSSSAGIPSDASSSSLAPPCATVADGKVKVAVAGIRKAHSAWDRACRDFLALVQRSADHPNTTGCKFQGDLQKIADEGSLIDKALVELEANFLKHGTLSDDDIKKGADEASQVQKKIKEGNKKAAALKPWFKL